MNTPILFMMAKSMDETDEHGLLAEVVAYYHEVLRGDSTAQAWLRGRGLDSAEMVDTLHLGYADRTLGLQMKRGSKLRARLEELGIFRVSSGHEHFNGAIVLPIFDEEGKIAQIYGRKIGSGLRKGTAMDLWLPRAHRAWNVAGLHTSKTVLLTKTAVDALTLWSAGVRNATFLAAVEGQLDAIRRGLFGIERLVIASEGIEDDARGIIEGTAIKLYRMPLAEGRTLNELVRRHPSPKQAIGERLDRVQTVGGAQAVVGEPASVALRIAATRSNAPSGASMVVTSGTCASTATCRTETSASVATSGTFASTVATGGAGASAWTLVTPEVNVEPSKEIAFELGDRKWRVRGLRPDDGPESIRVNIMVSREAVGYHVDVVNLLSHRHRACFVKQASLETGVADDTIKKDLGTILLRLEALKDELQDVGKKKTQVEVKLTAEEQEEAMELLRDPRLLDRISADFERLGLIGEKTNAIVGYLAATSRRLDDPLAILIQSSSAAGKTNLMDAILRFIPAEDRVQYSAMTGQSLYYLGNNELKHRVLAIAEEAGAERASYALKLLQSDGSITIASTGKEPATGRLTTQEYRVQGPTAILMTTTAIEIDPELQNRCLVLTVDESREQTRAIHEHQRTRETLEGVLERRQREQIIRKHENAQRLLRGLLVVNPFAPSLTFSDGQTRARRDHARYLALIRTIALLYQFQRERRTTEVDGVSLEYIEVAEQDIENANRLCQEVLGRTLDELPVQSRRLLGLVHAFVQTSAEAKGIDRRDFCFTRRELREAVGWGDTQVYVHLKRLVALEYMSVVRKQSHHEYHLEWDGEGNDGDRFVLGLTTSGAVWGADAKDSATIGPAFGGVSADFRSEDIKARPTDVAGLRRCGLIETDNARRTVQPNGVSYREGAS